VRATFFLLGRNVEQAPWCGVPPGPGARGALGARGHVLGNHSYSHLRPDRWRELAPTSAAARPCALAAAGHSIPLPYGIQRVEGGFPLGAPATRLDPRLAVIASMGLAHRHWTKRFRRLDVAPADAPALAARMISRHVGACQDAGIDAVLDLHDSAPLELGYERAATLEA